MLTAVARAQNVQFKVASCCRRNISAFFKICFCFYQATACAMEKVQRFADLSREEIAGLIEGKDSKNTQLVTKTALNC